VEIQIPGTVNTAAGNGTPGAQAPPAVSSEPPSALSDVNVPDAPGNLTKLQLTKLGSRPYSCPEVVPSWWKLRSTHDSVIGLFDTLYLVRKTRATKNNEETRGRLHRDAQDLLRAAIVFTSAGLDASVQALIEQAAPVLITGNPTAKAKFEVFIDEQVRAPKAEEDFLAALKQPDAHTQLVQLYIHSKTKTSFQGSEDLRSRAGGALGMTNGQIPKRRFAALDTFFTARNDVAHRLDMDNLTNADATPPRNQRNQEDVSQMCDEALLLVRDLIKATAANLGTWR
jgi:hypothetical protein